MTSTTIVADLHNHSTASDGDFSPTQLVEHAHKLGLCALGITDHDTIAGVDEALDAGDRLGVQIIPGIEVTLRFTRPGFTGSLHLLLYIPHPLVKSPSFRQGLMQIVEGGRGDHLVAVRVAAINKEFGPQSKASLLKQPLTVEEVASFGSNLTRRHIFQALSTLHGITDKAQSMRILANDSPAYVPSGIDMTELAPLLKEYELLKVLAHPAAGSFPGESHYKEVLPPLEVIEELLPAFLAPEPIGINGLEIYYPGHISEHCTLLSQWAHTHNLVVTGGSDCHDALSRPLGTAGLGQAEWEVFWQTYQSL